MRKVLVALLLLGLAIVAGCERSDPQRRTTGQNDGRAVPVTGQAENPSAPARPEASRVEASANDASLADLPRLGEPGSDCTVAHRVYDFSFPSIDPVVATYEAAMDMLDGATAFISDGCDPDRILIGIDGDSFELPRLEGADSNWTPGTQHAYAGDDFKVEINVGDPVASFPRQEAEMTLCLVRAAVIVRHRDRRWPIDGTASYFSALENGKCE